ncbi:MAG TPA: class I SAM-dependent methyltransferase [Mycobacteriales bacterium]|nr:class I SAM-dependent methyltransferase [Mycobacteriales bacterium]
MKLTGERVTTPEGGFNPTWQRHVAAYQQIGKYLDPARVLDLGCGIGHSYQLLNATKTIGMDLDEDALGGQDRPTVRADMRRIPLRSESVSAVASVQSLEHVPDPERVIAEVSRVLAAAGTAVFVTPNRLTFGRPDEIIDPWHFIEFDSDELRALCTPSFSSVEILGLFGSEQYMDFQMGELRRLDRVLRLDPLRLRRLIPRRGWQWGYSALLNRSRRPGAKVHPAAEHITPDDFFLAGEGLADCLDLVAVCRGPRNS